MSTKCGCDLLSISSGRHLSAILNFSVTSTSATVRISSSLVAVCSINSTTSNSSSSCCNSVLTAITSFRPFRPSSLASISRPERRSLQKKIVIQVCNQRFLQTENKVGKVCYKSKIDLSRAPPSFRYYRALLVS